MHKTVLYALYLKWQDMYDNAGWKIVGYSEYVYGPVELTPRFVELDMSRENERPD
jgi:hypothetical protein